MQAGDFTKHCPWATIAHSSSSKTNEADFVPNAAWSRSCTLAFQISGDLATDAIEITGKKQMVPPCRQVLISYRWNVNFLVTYAITPAWVTYPKCISESASWQVVKAIRHRKNTPFSSRKRPLNQLKLEHAILTGAYKPLWGKGRKHTMWIVFWCRIPGYSQDMIVTRKRPNPCVMSTWQIGLVPNMWSALNGVFRPLPALQSARSYQWHIFGSLLETPRKANWLISVLLGGCVEQQIALTHSRNFIQLWWKHYRKCISGSNELEFRVVNSCGSALNLVKAIASFSLIAIFTTTGNVAKIHLLVLTWQLGTVQGCVTSLQANYQLITSVERTILNARNNINNCHHTW